MRSPDKFLISSEQVDTKLDELLERFLAAAGDLFRKNQSYIKEFEGGRYSCAYVTASKRLKQALAVDRELLVIASTFADQQTRTIKFLQGEISNSAGRVEPGVAVIIHLDPNGNSKLRNWGREVGISVLPINGRVDLGAPRDIEKALSTQLFSHDPFDVTGPVSGDNQFFGRRDEAIDLARKLQLGQIRSCLGIRKVGKTSIINRVIKEIPFQFESRAIMIDCSKDDIFELNAEGLLSSISFTLQKMNAEDSSYCALEIDPKSRDLSSARRSVQEAVIDADGVVLIIFDEVDYITPGSPTVRHWGLDFNRFWRNLRSIYQECDRLGKPFSLLIGGVSTYWFTVDQISGIENAALAFVPEEFLSPMPLGATVAMLRRLGKVSGINFTDDAAELISLETGNMPFWARKCCSFIHRQVPISSRPLTINKDDVSPLVEVFIENEGTPIAEVALNHLFRVHPEMRAASVKIYAGEASDVGERTKRTLRKYGVTNAKDEFAGGMIYRAVGSILSNPEESYGVPQGVEDLLHNGLQEWAEDLAALGQRRNLIERRLRSIVLNFLRMQALQNKKLDALGDQVSSSLSSSRRAQLMGLPLDALFQKLMWPELVSLVSKNWPTFEAIFGDKRQFEENSTIINDRPDAHAKEWDAADFALYRRSLQLLEDRLAKLQ